MGGSWRRAWSEAARRDWDSIPEHTHVVASPGSPVRAFVSRITHRASSVLGTRQHGAKRAQHGVALEEAFHSAPHGPRASGQRVGVLITRRRRDGDAALPSLPFERDERVDGEVHGLLYAEGVERQESPTRRVAPHELGSVAGRNRLEPEEDP